MGLLSANRPQFLFIGHENIIFKYFRHFDTLPGGACMRNECWSMTRILFFHINKVTNMKKNFFDFYEEKETESERVFVLASMFLASMLPLTSLSLCWMCFRGMVIT